MAQARPTGTPACAPQRCPVGSRLVTTSTFDDLEVTQETLLWDGADRVEFRTHVDGSIGQDRLLRVRFATNVPGGLPVYQTGLSVIGRPLGDAEVDVAEHTYHPRQSGARVVRGRLHRAGVADRPGAASGGCTRSAWPR